MATALNESITVGSSSLQEFEVTTTINNASVAYAVPAFVFTMDGAVDFTFRLAQPQIEVGAPTPYMPTTTAVASRVAGDLQIEDINTLSWFNANEGTVSVECYQNQDMTD